MAKANLQEQARDLGLSDEGTVEELRADIESVGQVPDDNYTGQVTESVDEGQASGQAEEAAPEQSREDAETAAVVIPEYEQRISAAAARGDDTELATAQEEYWQARQERAQQDREARESEGEE